MRRLFDKEDMGLKFQIHSLRFYGEPKLTKPKELKGIKQSLSVEYLDGKCKCSVFILDSDVWIRHNDYFSETLATEELGAPLEVLTNKYLKRDRSRKFIYSDAWGSIVLRNQAWIRIEGIMEDINSSIFPLDIVNEIRRQQEILHNFDEYELCCSEMERFWEMLVKGLKEVEYVGKELKC